MSIICTWTPPKDVPVEIYGGGGYGMVIFGENLSPPNIKKKIPLFNNKKNLYFISR